MSNPKQAITVVEPPTTGVMLAKDTTPVWDIVGNTAIIKVPGDMGELMIIRMDSTLMPIDTFRRIVTEIAEMLNAP